MTLLQQFADLLSLITIGMCFVLKIPQILKLISVKSADEMSTLGLFLELTSYTVMTSYNYTNGYSLLSYLEYPIILAQEYILIFFVLKYLNRINMWSFLGAIVYFTLSSCLLLGIVPKIVLTLLVVGTTIVVLQIILLLCFDTSFLHLGFQPMCTPISASSKVVQLLAILRAKNAESVSPLTWFISAFTNLTRVFTIWMDSADILLLGNFIISVLLSSSIMFSALYYRSHPLKQD
ncbi:PQ-loop repeat-containing protein 3 [Temnothorax longispinosus]|uniref:PQ-loop repeat-containing protein 3 n=1 Tax=Temnothorax longispinosus TaxID=300112 RepID=A0A4S2JIC5_9HYME|nr:PQ-loop repeat-containing protein 3 [Temnothorax longispinosus]